MRHHRICGLRPFRGERSAGRGVSSLAVSLLLLLPGCGPKVRHQEQAPRPEALGTVNFPVSCSARAQVEFDRAVALLHHMTYPAAREGFERVAAIDPHCAMAHWGIAMTLFQPLWPTRPGREELRKGWEAVRTAEALRPPTERERLFIEAAAAFFRDPDSTDYWGRIRRWEQATAKVYTAFPHDPEAAAFYALAHLATAPPERVSREHADRAAAILLDIYRRNPDHPGAMHYLVHANDVPGRERESLEIVRKYETVAPRNPHALHMPTHIYTRLGDWDAVIDGNLRAAEAALDRPVGDERQYVSDEFPHAIEYLIYAYLQKGADDLAAGQLKRLRETPGLQPSFKTAFHLASTQARYALERGAWGEAISLVPREPATLDWDRFAWAEAVVWFARGLGAAHMGKVEQARAAAERLRELEATTEKAGEDQFTRNVRILRLMVRAWLAFAEQDRALSVTLMREAAELEASTPKHAVTPGATLPAHELLGDLFLAQGQPAEALLAYRHSLALYPGRFNSLAGAARAARDSGDEPGARSFYRQLLDAADEATTRPAVDDARRFVSGAR
jgi:tetratricopeptide (TPR) repeat protein